MKKNLLVPLLLVLVLIFSGNAHAAGRLFWADYDNNTIVELDPDTGAEINTLASPISQGDGCVGLAFASNRLFFSVCGSAIYELNPNTGAVIHTIPLPDAILDTDGLGFSGTELYVLDYEASLIYVLNPSTGAVIRTLDPGVNLVGGISYAGGRNSVFVTDVGNGVIEDPTIIYEINATTGAVINSFDGPSLGIYGVGYSSARGTLFLGSVPQQTPPLPNPDDDLLSLLLPGQPLPAGSENTPYSGRKGISGDTHTIYEVNPDTGAVIDSLPISPVWALASDEAGGDGPGTAIPTMNEWGMIIFMAVVCIGAIFYIRRMNVSV